MWNVGTTYKDQSVASNTYPHYVVRLYEDKFNFTGSTLWGTNPYNKSFYDYNYVIQYAASQVSGTPTLVGMTVKTSSLGTDLTLNGSVSIGSCILPIITPYYNNASWDTLQYQDFSYTDDDTNQPLFKENFESYEGIARNGGYIGANNNSIVYLGTNSTGNWIRIINTGNGDATDIEYPEPNLPNTILEEGEINLKLRIDNFGMAGPSSTDPRFKVMTFNTTQNGKLGIEVMEGGAGGTFLILRAYNSKGVSANNVTIGTLGTGIPYHISMNYKKVASDNTGVEVWWNNNYTTGTLNKIGNFGNYKSLELGEYESASPGGSSGTYWLDDVLIYGTREHTGTRRTTYVTSAAQINYYIRTGTDGTNFSDWQNITGTRSYSQEVRSANTLNALYIGTSVQKGAYAQVMIVMSVNSGTRIPTAQGTFDPYCQAVELTSHLDLEDNSIFKLNSVGFEIENENKYGLITTNSNSISLINAESPYLKNKKFLGGI